jgi:hypothetical protein
MSTMWNGMFVYPVESGTVINDPDGKRDPITVTDETSAVIGGRKLYCTKSTEDKLIARIKTMRGEE